MQPLINAVVTNQTRGVNDDVTDDLPVNPLYCINYTIRASQNAASTTTDLTAGLSQMLALVLRLEVLFRGTTIVSGSLTDLAVMSAMLSGKLPFVLNSGDAASQDLAVTIPIFLGRMKTRGAECFPATRRGELTIRRLWASSAGNLGGGTLSEQIETVELLDAAPSAFLKYVTLARSFLTTGDNDVDLPLGNMLAGALLFGTTPYNALPSVATWLKTKLLVDNVEWSYALSNWETLHGMMAQRLPLDSDASAHVHTENLAAAYTIDVATGRPRSRDGILANYAYLDFDMFGDDKSLLETKGRGRVHLRATAGTADAARVLPLELVDLGTQQAA